MSPDAETVGGALADVLEHLIDGVPEGWTLRAPGAIGCVTGVPVPALNGVWVYGAETSSEDVSALLDRVAAAGLPHCVEFSPRCRGAIRDLARSRQLHREDDVPLMLLEDASSLVDGDGPMSIRALEPPEATLHADVAAAGFEAPPEIFRRLMPPAVLEHRGVRTYLGEVGDEPVATGIGIQLQDYVGIFNIATVPSARRHGYAAAITSRAVRDGLADGAGWAWLQSSAAGYGVYERLGFTTLERWECWISG